LNAPSDGSDVIVGSSAFQTFAAATGKAQSPMVCATTVEHASTVTMQIADAYMTMKHVAGFVAFGGQ